MPTQDAIIEQLKPFGQEHLLRFWDELDVSARESLAEQIAKIDFAQITKLYAQRNQGEEISAMANQAGEPAAIKLDDPASRFSQKDARLCGEEALAGGKVAVLLVAGGQGTRLGFEHPKGMYPIGPVSGCSIFQIHVEKIVATARRYGAPVPFYVMVSPATDQETRDYFAAKDRFGLDENDFRLFCQGTMPAVDDASGRVLLVGRGQIAVSPDGHGGTLAALQASGALAEMTERGIEQVFYFQVDNPLVDICSPEFLGYHLLAQSELTSQVVAKKSPKDRVGNVVEIDGRLRVIEYSDLPDEEAQRRRDDGSLAIWAGSIAVHVFDVAFLRRMVDKADALPFHIAHKKVDYVDSDGVVQKATEPNAYKFERFIFDLLPAAENALVVEVDPTLHFAPLKNASGAPEDTPEAVRAQMIALHTDWLRKAGVDVAEGTPVEISPLTALDSDELATKVSSGTQISEATYLHP